MIIYDQKKAVGTIMASRKHSDGSTTTAAMKPQRSTAEDGEVDGRHAAAQDVIAAMDQKDPQKLMEAMANFHDLHRMHSETAQDTTPDVPEQQDSEE